MGINVITCEDVLSAAMCKKLRDAAEMFKIKAAEVDKMIREAIAKGVTKAKEIFKIVQAKLIEMAKNFKCTDALSKDICDKIAEVAAKLKVKMAEVMKVIKGIIEEIKKHFFPGEVNVIVCEDVLADNVCKALKEAAKVLKVKIEEVDAAVREAVNKGLTKAKDIIRFVRSKIDSFVKEFKCEDVLDEGICAKIHEIAALVKVDAAKVDAFIRKLVLKGYTKAKEIIDMIKKHFFPGVEGELINVITCEDVLSATVCHDLRAIAAKLKVKIEMIDEIIRQLVKEKITEAKEIIRRVREKLVELATNFKCI